MPRRRHQSRRRRQDTGEAKSARMVWASSGSHDPALLPPEVARGGIWYLARRTFGTSRAFRLARHGAERSSHQAAPQSESALGAGWLKLFWRHMTPQDRRPNGNNAFEAGAAVSLSPAEGERARVRGESRDPLDQIHAQ